MRRYQGEELAPGCRIAVIANDALGNYVVTTPLLQMIRSRHRPATLDFYTGNRTKELWSNDSNIDAGVSALGLDPGEIVVPAGPQYDLIVNVEESKQAKALCGAICGEETYVSGPGYCHTTQTDLPYTNDMQGRLAADKHWMALDVCKRYPCLQTGFIGEILCRIAYLDGDIPCYSVPVAECSIDVPDVLIATAASLRSKLWPAARWIETIEWLRAHGLTVGLLGAKRDAQKLHWFGASIEDDIVKLGLVTDLRGKLRLPEVVGALKKARVCFTLDNGILHLAAAVETQTVGLFREGYHRLWAPRIASLRALSPGEGRSVGEIGTTEALAALELALSRPSGQ